MDHAASVEGTVQIATEKAALKEPRSNGPTKTQANLGENRSLPFRDGATEEERYRRTCAVMQEQSAQREIFYKALACAQRVHEGRDLEAAIAALPEMRVNLRTSRFYVRELYEAGALDRWTIGDGKGADEPDSSPDIVSNVTSDVTAENWNYRPSAAGERVLADLAPLRRLSALAERESELAKAFAAILSWCVEPRSRVSVEEMLGDCGLLPDRVFSASYCLDRLEEAGGLVWDHGWTTTGEGGMWLTDICHEPKDE